MLGESRDPPYMSVARRFFEDRHSEEPVDRIPDWMSHTDLFVLGVVSTYANANDDVFEELFRQEQSEGDRLELENVDVDDVRSSVQKLTEKGVIERAHRSYRITDLGEEYAYGYPEGPSASGFLSSHRLGTGVLALLIILGWITALPLLTPVCRDIGFSGAFTCGLPLVLIPLLLVSGLILSGHGWRIGKEAAGLIGSDIRHGPRSLITESTYKDAVYSRLASAVPAKIIAASAMFVLLLLAFDVYIANGRLNNQIYGLTFDGFGGYLLAKSEFLRGELRLARGSDMQLESSSDEIHNVFDGAFGFSLLILGFSLQFAAVFPTMQLSGLIWENGRVVVEFLLDIFRTYLL